MFPRTDLVDFPVWYLVCFAAISTRARALVTRVPQDARCAAGTSSSLGGRECRICLTTDNQQDIVEPCGCTGTVQFAHLECLRCWCVENLALKCEICGSVYKNNVVEALMSTLVEAQDRQVAAQGLSDDYGIRLDVLDAAVQHREAARGRGAAPQRPAVPPEDAVAVREAQQRMQAFLEELLQLYVRTPSWRLAPTAHCVRPASALCAPCPALQLLSSSHASQPCSPACAISQRA